MGNRKNEPLGVYKGGGFLVPENRIGDRVMLLLTTALLLDQALYPVSGLREVYRFRPVDQPQGVCGTRSHRSGGI